jgi:hypothetical protein
MTMNVGLVYQMVRRSCTHGFAAPRLKGITIGAQERIYDFRHDILAQFSLEGLHRERRINCLHHAHDPGRLVLVEPRCYSRRDGTCGRDDWVFGLLVGFVELTKVAKDGVRLLEFLPALGSWGLCVKYNCRAGSEAK